MDTVDRLDGAGHRPGRSAAKRIWPTDIFRIAISLAALVVCAALAQGCTNSTPYGYGGYGGYGVPAGYGGYGGPAEYAAYGYNSDPLGFGTYDPFWSLYSPDYWAWAPYAAPAYYGVDGDHDCDNGFCGGRGPWGREPLRTAGVGGSPIGLAGRAGVPTAMGGLHGGSFAGMGGEGFHGGGFHGGGFGGGGHR
ncbi:MAG TPA: hypothetical protein VND20_04515 [Candidatus Binataceae bacterium]|nr:hypothetical protein [Candidatus Binataceae bacterium]